jgi:hypothetical protein
MAPFFCLWLPGDELEDHGEEFYAPGLHDLVVVDEPEQESG